ncbi:SRPBCC family protein [Oceanobacillus sojae]|uniref:Activator of Hsp90 ATPase homologue 1/2-like C-terminal domain-containing protein n=1 Tax=Oceanobacillus sojae TaxID=582851 RepID=A0A511ZNX3_9BACI|nr:SRPBCC domain-containing protein [Oceanobacillus sojae]GEN89089.1 hypothetical protein OSO01_38280 [Oceanobacillus sojae]
MNHNKSSILILENAETVWNAITDDEKFSEWYAPGSTWSIPELEVGKQANFTLMPSAYNNLQEGESIPMSFVIKEMKTNNVFSLYSEDDEFLLAFELISQPDGTQVTVNMEGFEESLENLKAFLAGKELPYA